MGLSYRGAVAVVQLIVFTPALCLGLLLASRHGWGKSSGWYFLIVLSLMRIVGGICEVIFVYKPSTGVETAAIICTSVGVAPLVALCSGLLSRVNDQIVRKINPYVFKATGLLGLTGAIIGITGGILQTNSTNKLKLNAEVQTAVVLFVAVFVAVVGIYLVLCFRTSEIPHGEKRLMVAVGVSLPFLLVRLLYALISDFAHSKLFSSAFGNVTVFLCMAVVEEIIVTIICVVVGLTLRIIPKAPTVSEEEQMPLEDIDGGPKPSAQGGQDEVRRQKTPTTKRKIRGPISMLYFWVKDTYSSRRSQQGS